MNKTIPPSDLIINQQQRIYHLDLRPDEIADTIILVGDPQRVSKVSKNFSEISVKREHREIISHTGIYQKKPMTVISTGMGPDNIDIVMNELDALKNIDFDKACVKEKPQSLDIFRIGTCGGLQAHLPLHAYIVGTHAVGLDNMLHYYQYAYDEKQRRLLTAINAAIDLGNIEPYLTSANPELLAHFSGDKAFAGMTATCSGFYGPQARQLRLAPMYPNMLKALTAFQYAEQQFVNFEMETAAIYGLGHLLGHRCCALNLMVANRVTEEFSGGYAQAMDDFILWSLDKIAAL